MLFANRNCPTADSGTKPAVFTLLWILIFLLALYLRMSGLFRGLGDHLSIFHPDEPKQVLALFNFLKGDYVRYYGSLFYDGYPYGLNHLDEYLLRPLLFLFGPDSLEHSFMYFYARLLRVAYGMFTVAMASVLACKLFRDRTAALLAMLLLAIAPLSVTVTHFATGDIGVDLFTALCLFFITLYSEGRSRKWLLFAAGAAVGASFASKYNGLLVGMVPATVLCLELLHTRDIRSSAARFLFLLGGTLAGVLFFTPNLLLDFGPTAKNILANFQFIKNYNVPPEIMAKTRAARAVLGLKDNSLSIIAALGYAACLFSLAGVFLAGRKVVTLVRSRDIAEMPGRQAVILAIAIYPFLFLFVSLVGKYVVQPFHFSSLQLPLILTVCFVFSSLRASRNGLLRIGSILLAVLIVLEYGRVSWRENFFWRHEDNVFHEQNLPASLYDAEAFYTHRSAPFRSLSLEPPNNSVFRNSKMAAKGPDADFWNKIGMAPLPQVPNPVGKDWIFLNGPVFPRNERTLFIHGERNGTGIKRYLVLPAGEKWPVLGVRSGSFPTEAFIDFGTATTSVKLEAHQQKLVTLEPKQWRESETDPAGKKKVLIIPLEISVPHDDIWVTVLATQKEKEHYTVFGGGQGEPLTVPEGIPASLEKEYHDALGRVRFLDLSLSWRVNEGKRIPMWEVAIPAGRYTLIAEVDGLSDESVITVELEDAAGLGYGQEKQTFPIGKGLQRIEYTFTKPFAPYQGRFVITGESGTCHIQKFKLFPDYRGITGDFERWRTTGIPPEWVTRSAAK